VTTQAGITGLLMVASCCVPLFSKTVFPYYLLEPYVLALLWWLGRAGTALNWRGIVPLLLTVDVFIVKAASAAPFTAAGAVESVVSSIVIASTIALVTLDLVRTDTNVAWTSDQPVHPLPRGAPMVGEVSG